MRAPAHSALPHLTALIKHKTFPAYQAVSQSVSSANYNYHAIPFIVFNDSEVRRSLLNEELHYCSSHYTGLKVMTGWMTLSNCSNLMISIISCWVPHHIRSYPLPSIASPAFFLIISYALPPWYSWYLVLGGPQSREGRKQCRKYQIRRIVQPGACWKY